MKYPKTRFKWLLREPLSYGANEAAEATNPEWPRYIRITDLREDGTLRTDSFKSLAPDLAEPYMLTEGDILFARSGATAGKAFLFRSENGPACYAGYLIRAKLNDNLIAPQFVYYFTQSDLYWRQISEATIQATIQNVSAERYASLQLPLPSRETQWRIVAFLDRETLEIDQLIAAKEKLLRLLAEKRQALITESACRGLFPDVKLKDSRSPWLGKIPEHWTAVRLKFAASVQTGITIGKDYGTSELKEYYYLRVANVQDGFLNLSDVSKVLVSQADAENCLLQKGDVLMNEGGDIDKLGRGCVWRAEVEPCLHQNHVFSVRPKSISSEWLALWTSTDVAKDFFINHAKRTTNLASISSSNLKELPVPLPPVTEQATILQHLKIGLQKIETTQKLAVKTIGLLRERRAALVAAAVTGSLEIS